MSKTKDALRAYIRNLTSEVEVVTQKPYTMVEILVYDSQTFAHGFWGAGRTYHGFAKCNPVDKWNPQRGYDIALGRAIKQAMCDWENYLSEFSFTERVNEIVEQTLA